MSKFSIQALGPGLLYAGAAVGVSHLVLSTKAGAVYGAGLLIVVLLANAVKYSFFEAAPRYVAATGNSLLMGYRKLGKWAVGIFAFQTLATMLIVQSAVALVTGGLAEEISGYKNEALPHFWALIMLCICAGILWVGKYQLLDKIAKFIIILLSITTVFALIFSLLNPVEKTAELRVFTFASREDTIALVGLIGWMPAPIDISVWHSMWSKSKNDSEGKRTSLKRALFDFKIGYWGTTFLGMIFLALGALAVYGTGIEIPNSGAGFARALLGFYTRAIGDWAYPLIALAAFTTMFSTTLTCLDAYARVVQPSLNLMFTTEEKPQPKTSYRAWLILIVIGSYTILYALISSLSSFLVFATAVSFIIAPVMAFLNYKVIYSPEVTKKFQPSKAQHAFTVICLLILGLFALYYIYFLAYVK